MTDRRAGSSILDALRQPVRHMRLRRQARRWAARMADDHAVAANLATFSAWVEQSPDHRHAFEKILAADNTRPVRPRFEWRPRPAPVLAFLFLVAVTGTLIAHVGSNGTAPQGALVFAGETGRWRTHALPDGSRLEVSPDGSVSATYTEARRHLILTGGGVIIHAAPDALRPLEVVAGAMTVRVVGTRFALIGDGNGGAMVAVEEGRVQVSPSHAPTISPLMLVADDTVHVARDGTVRRALGGSDLATAARNGWRQFTASPLETVLMAVEAETGTRIFLAPGQTTRPVTGRFNVQRADETLNLIAATTDLSVLRLPFETRILY